jgi:hypothetical protein
MQRIRFSIGSLIGFIVICGVAFAALKESNDWWEKGTFTLMVVVLLTSVLLAVHRTGARRSFWVGFALFGSVYLGLSLVSPVESRLVTSPALGYVYSKLPGQASQDIVLTLAPTGSGTQVMQNATIAFSPSGNQLAAGSNGSIHYWNFNKGAVLPGWGSSMENFVKIGHTWIALMLAWFGGMLSRRLARASVSAERPAELAGSEP